MASSSFSNTPSRQYIGVSGVTGNFTFDSSQDGYYLRYTGIANVTGNFRTDAAHYIQPAAVFTMYQGGAGTITISGDAGVTVNGPLNTQGQYCAIQTIKACPNVYDAIGGY